MAVPPTPIRVPSQRLLAPSVTLLSSVANDKGDSEIIPRTVLRSPCIELTAGKNSAESHLAASHRFKWGPLPPNEVGRMAYHVR